MCSTITRSTFSQRPRRILGFNQVLSISDFGITVMGGLHRRVFLCILRVSPEAQPISPGISAFLVRLRAARTSAGLTQAEVAKQLAVPQSFISKCESGERRVDIVELQALARLYKKALTYFVDSKGR